MNYKASDHTFVVCAYKKSPYLEKCIVSLIKQSEPSNIIIATSTPNDLIRTISLKYGCTLFVRSGISEISDDWNYAINCAKTQLVTIAHQDDIYCECYVSHMLKHLNEAKNPLIFFGNYNEIRSEKKHCSSKMLRIKRFLLGTYSNSMLRSRSFFKRLPISFGNPICCPSVTYVLDKLPNPLFNKGFRSNLDWDAWERISLLKGDFVYDKEIIMLHRVHENSETSACIQNDIRTNEDLEMLKRFWPNKIATMINKVYYKAQKYN